MIEVEIRGLHVYDPTTQEIRSRTTNDIACWFIDTDYNGESFFVRHAYFTWPDRRVSLLESIEDVLYMLDQQTGNWLRHPLAAPEFQAIRNMPVQENTVSPFFVSPSVVGGEFYVLSNPTHRKQGAKVLRFDSQGNLRARYLCPLPTSVAPPTATNPNGYLTPTNIVVSDRTLLLISGFQKIVASYSLN